MDSAQPSRPLLFPTVLPDHSRPRCFHTSSTLSALKAHALSVAIINPNDSFHFTFQKLLLQRVKSRRSLSCLQSSVNLRSNTFTSFLSILYILPVWNMYAFFKFYIYIFLEKNYINRIKLYVLFYTLPFTLCILDSPIPLCKGEHEHSLHNDSFLRTLHQIRPDQPIDRDDDLGSHLIGQSAPNTYQSFEIDDMQMNLSPKWDLSHTDVFNWTEV